MTKRLISAALSAAVCLSAFALPQLVTSTEQLSTSAVSISDFPEEYQYAADWIWTNRIEREKSTERRNTIFDQIDAGKGTINYVVKWQSYRTVTYEQRQQFKKLLSDSINAWNDWLAGYDGWKYDHIDVKVVGWAVIDKSCLLDIHNDETVYTDTNYYDEPIQEEIPVHEEQQSSLITANMVKHGASLPTQGNAKMVVFYVDFPDCRYDTTLRPQMS